MQTDVTEKLQKALEGDLTDYRAIPFWSWNNELDEGELVKQIEQMHEAGMGGFIMHARLGLTTEYLGEKWFSCIDACLKKAKELGMNAWVYDENGWPSGFVGGKLLENEAFRAQFLEYAVTSTFDESAFAVFTESADGYARITAPVADAKAYHNVYLRTSPANTDILEPAVVDAFIKETHEEYYKRFKDSFGKELKGFFTDEPQYYRRGTPFPRSLTKAYAERYGEDVKDGLVWLFLHDERGYGFRHRYYTLVNDLYVENFYKKLYDWCEAHGCQLTGHSLDENALWTQMWGSAGCMPSYEYEHIPAIDCLGRYCPSPLPPKQVGSVASQMGIKHVLTETFGCAGNDITPQELKSLGEFQYFNGVNLMSHHLFPYSMAGQAKHDHPPVFSKHANWWEGFRSFNDHFTKLGYIVANTKENYDVLVIHPLRSIYLDYIRKEDGNSVVEQEEAFRNTLTKLHKNGVLYQLADERILERHGKVEGNKLIIGKCVYDAVIVPDMKNISAFTVALLKAYTGKLWLEKAPRYVNGERTDCGLRSNMTFQDVLARAQVKFFSEDGQAVVTARSGEIGEYLFIKNYSKDEPTRIQMQGVAENYKALDLETFALTDISNQYTIPASGSLILMKDKTAKPVVKRESKEDVTARFTVSGVTDNYFVSDYASFSYDGENFGREAYLQPLFEELLRADYKGKLYVRHTFTVHGKMPMKVVLENNRFFSVRFNGTELTLMQNDFDINYREADVTALIKEGKNELIYGVDYYQHEGVHFALFNPLATESMRNCLYYDTHIENVYLQGDFVVNADMSVSPRVALPEITSENYKKGYPFFKGSMVLDGTYGYDGGGERILSLKGRFQMAKLFINGMPVNMTTDAKKNITKYLKNGENSLRIVLHSSLRNLFGPHHCKPEFQNWGVSPQRFTMRGEWANGIPEIYTEKYVCVPFGVDLIEMITPLQTEETYAKKDS